MEFAVVTQAMMLQNTLL